MGPIAGVRHGLSCWDALTQKRLHYGHKGGWPCKEAERKPMWILLEATETAFQPFTDSLRVHGVIKEAKIDIGSHHTHVISPGDEIELTREGGLSKSDKSLLKEAIASGKKTRSGLMVVCLLYTSPSPRDPH